MKDLKVGVVGLGKLGLPLAAIIADSNFSVTGIDIDLEYVNKLKSKQFNFSEPELNDYLIKNDANMDFSTNFSYLKNTDVIYLIVPTPSDNSSYFINDYLINAIKEVGKVWRNAAHARTLVIVSTVMPGSTRNILIPTLELAAGEKCGENIQVIYSPEFIAIGSVIRDLREPDILLIGAKNEASTKHHLLIMKSIIKTTPAVRFLNFEEAELVKLLVNNYITTKITFANQIAEFTDFFPNADPNIIAEAIGNDSRIGKKYLKPGLGFGGPCFPRDTKALAAIAAEYNSSSELPLAVEIINRRQPQLMAKRIFNQEKNLKIVGVYGLAYKQNATLVEESQAVSLANEIAIFGVQVITYDPLINSRPFDLHEKIGFVNDALNLREVDLLICTQSISPKDKFQLKDVKKYYIGGISSIEA